MSGRKSTEVNGLLARGKDARDAGSANYYNGFSAAGTTVKKNQAKIDEIHSRLSKAKLYLDESCRKEFPGEAAQLEKQFQEILKANTGVNYLDKIGQYTKENGEIEKRLQDADKEGERIRSSIKGKNWYCDQEYKDAEKLVSAYKKIAQDKSALAAKANQAAQDSDKERIRYAKLEEQMGAVLNASANLRKRAEELIALRSKAKDARDYVQNELAKIEKTLAYKFMGQEYDRLGKLVSDMVALDDAKAVSQVGEVSEKISIFANELKKRHAEFLEKKERAESALAGNKELLSTGKNFYFDPIDYFKNKDNSKKIELLDYITEYSDKSELAGAIQNGMDKVRELIEQEQFDEAEIQAKANAQQIEKAASYAALLQEHLIENFYVARDIKSVMTRMGFETGAFKLDGSVKNGWKITAKNPGGECIDFSQVFIDDDGEVKIDIDHKTAGSCASKWEDICGALDDVGIHIERIDMLHGGNVINKREGKHISQPDPANDGLLGQN